MSRSKSKKKSAIRTQRRASKHHQNAAVVSPEAIRASLRSECLGDLALSEAELEELARAVSIRHDNSLRIRRDRTGVFPIATQPVPWYPNAVWPRDPGAYRPSKSIDYAAGDYYLQDAGSLLALAAASTDSDDLQGKIVLDLCAAPGGKAGALLEAIDPTESSSRRERGFLLANEIIGSRLAPLAYNLARTGSDRYAITNLDPDVLADRLPGVFDVIIVDAPCSGQAMMARGKQSATAVAETQIATNVARQRRILKAADRLLRPGGRLIYSTCTFAVAENEEQIRFLVDELTFRPAPVQSLVPYASPLADAAYRLWPHRHACAGSFAASLEKPESGAPEEHHRRSDFWARSKSTAAAPVDAMEQLPFLFASNAIWYQARDWIVDGFPDDAPAWTSEDYITGPEVAHRTAATWKPSHAAALRHHYLLDVERMELDDQTARMYLSGQAIPATGRGWQIVEHQQRPLGWIKGDGRIGKNHLPTHARVQVVERIHAVA